MVNLWFTDVKLDLPGFRLREHHGKSKFTVVNIEIFSYGFAHNPLSTISNKQTCLPKHLQENQEETFPQYQIHTFISLPGSNIRFQIVNFPKQKS